MKRISLLLAAALLWGGCNFSYQTSTTATSGSASVWAWNTNGKSVEVRTEGEVQYNEDYTGISSVAEDGWFQIEEDKGKGGRLKVTPAEGGVLTYQYWRNNRETAFGPEGEQWLATVLRHAVGHGLDGQKRAQRMLERGGPDAVLAEVDRLESDYAKRIYLSVVLESEDVETGDVRNALAKTASFESDYYKRQIFDRLPARALGDDEVATQCFAVLNTVESDYEKRRMIDRLLTLRGGEENAPEFVSGIYRTVQGMASDYEKSRLLRAAIEVEWPLNVEFFDSVGSLNSDFELSRVLRAVFDRTPLPEESKELAMKAASNLSSDHERTRILNSLVKNLKGGGAAPPEFFALLNSIGSSYNRARVLKDLAGLNSLSDATFKGAVESCKGLQSDFDKAGALTQIAQHAGDEARRNLILEAARTIQSDHDRGRVMAKVFPAGE